MKYILAMKTIKFIAIVVLSAAVAFGLGIGVLALTGSANAFISVSVFGAIAIALALGAFDGRNKENYDSIRHRDGRSYGQAAIFIGAACVFTGTIQDCEELSDDLWHYGQQARVEMLSGNEDFNVL